MMYLLVVDTETTGVPEEDPDSVMIEFACALYRTEHRATAWQFGTIISAAHENPCEAINGISEKDLAIAPGTEEALDPVWRMLAYSPSIDAIVAHNAEFDKHYVLKATELPPTIRSSKWVDSVEIEYPNQRGSKRLAHLCADHGIFGQQTHRALDDVMMLCNLLSKVNNLEEQVQDMLKPQGLWQASCNYHTRHLAKEHGFRWDAPNKRWLRKWPLDKPWPEDLPFKVKIVEKL